jgi:hypothetical protein
MFKKLKNVGKKEVTLNTEPNNKSSLEPSNEKDPRDKLKKDKSKSSGGGRSVDGSERSKERSKKDRDGKGESYVFIGCFVFGCWRVLFGAYGFNGLLN